VSEPHLLVSGLSETDVTGGRDSSMKERPTEAASHTSRSSVCHSVHSHASSVLPPGPIISWGPINIEKHGRFIAWAVAVTAIVLNIVAIAFSV
jgi:hypothetical protein